MPNSRRRKLGQTNVKTIPTERRRCRERLSFLNVMILASLTRQRVRENRTSSQSLRNGFTKPVISGCFVWHHLKSWSNRTTVNTLPPVAWQACTVLRLGKRALEHYVVFGTPGTVKNSLERFKNFAAVIVDEAHGITPTIKFIIDDLRAKNPQLRVLGLSATPYRLGSGYIYQLDQNDRAISEHETDRPIL